MLLNVFNEVKKPLTIFIYQKVIIFLNLDRGISLIIDFYSNKNLHQMIRKTINTYQMRSSRLALHNLIS
jgi:hypothetical protein